jgi:hypothetical protein
MNESKLKLLNKVNLQLLDLSDKLIQVAETLDAIVASEFETANKNYIKPKND